MRDGDETPARAAPGEPMLEQLDRLSAVIAARESELRRLRTQIELRDLYIQELHAQLRRQAERLEQIEKLARRAALRARAPFHEAQANPGQVRESPGGEPHAPAGHLQR
ncbi:MAG: hypothetical protein ACP5UT_14095 [Bryobacteraceae bacterium]